MARKRTPLCTPRSEEPPAKRSRPQALEPSSQPSTSGSHRQEISTSSNIDATENENAVRITELEKSVRQIAEHLGVSKKGTRNKSKDKKEMLSTLASKFTSSNTSASTSAPVLNSSGGLQAPNVPPPDNLDIKGLSMDDMSSADIVKLVYLATTVKRKRTSARKEVEKPLAEKVGEVFAQALDEQSFNPVKILIKTQMVRLKNEIYSGKSDKRNWQAKSDFMSWYLSIKHLKLDASSLDREAASVRKLCGMADIDEVEGAFMNNENLVMCKICDLMTSKQVSALWKVCSEDKKSMPAFSKNEKSMPALKKITETIKIDTPGMKELVFFYIIRYLELKQKFNTLYTDLLLEYIGEIRSSHEGCTDNLKQVCKILETYKILVQPVGYCLVFCVLEKRKGAKQEIENITNTFGTRLGYKVVVKSDPTKKDIETEAKLCSESAALGIYDSFVCFLLAHGDPTDITLFEGEKIARKDFLQMFSRETCFPKKPKLFLMGSCQGGKVIPFTRLTDKKKQSDDDMENLNVPVPDTERDIDTVHAESDRLVAYATLAKHAAVRNQASGSYFVTSICKQIEDLAKQDEKSINVVEVLQRANRKIHSRVFNTKDAKGIHRLGKQACYYESTLQKNFCFRHL